MLFDHIERLFLEVTHDPFSQFGTDAFDHARAKITLDPGNGGRQGLFADLCFELGTVFGMLVPVSLQTQVFAG